MGDITDGEQSLSNLFVDEAEADSYLLFAEQSMADSLSLVVAEREHKKQRNSSTNNSLQASKSISTLFGKLAWNGSCTSFMGDSEELLHFSSSADDLDASNNVLGLTKKRRCSRRFVPKYKHKSTTLQTKPSPIKNRSDANSARNIRLQQSPYALFFGNVANDTRTDLDASISVADVLTVNSTQSKEMIHSKFEDLVEGHDSTLPESKRKAKRGLSRKESCRFELGRNKLPKTTTSSHHKDDIAPRCPRRCESPNEVKPITTIAGR